MLFGKPRSAETIAAAEALPGRPEPVAIAERHLVLGTPMTEPFPEGVEVGVFGMGCFWGAERIFWEAPGVHTTAVGYAGGFTANPTYEEVCSGRTGHAEVVLVAYDTAHTSFGEMLRLFWEGHDPTQGMRQGNDVGSQYRSVVLCRDEHQLSAAETSRDAYQSRLTAGGHGAITTQIEPAEPPHPFYYAEDYHQQYLAKQGVWSVGDAVIDAERKGLWSVGGYCGLQPTGIACPVGSNVPLSSADQRSRGSSA